MKKRIISLFTSFALVFGTLAVLPEITDGKADIAVTAEAASTAKSDDFIVGAQDQSDDLGYIIGYSGKGGDVTVTKSKFKYKDYFGTAVGYVKGVGKGAFKNNTTITSVTFSKINSGDWIIGSEAFMGCKNLKKVVFNGPVSIGSHAFAKCPNLEEVVFNGDYYVSEYNYDDLEYDEPDEYNWISKEAFAYCPKLKKITFAKGASVNIGERAFLSCTSLKTVKFPEGETRLDIENGAFSNCLELTSLTLPLNTDISRESLGYMWDNDKEEYIWADGKASAKMAYMTSEGKMKVAKKIQKPITLKILKDPEGVAGLEYNVKYYGINYTYYNPKLSDKLSAPDYFSAEAGSGIGKIDLTWELKYGADAYRIYKYNPSTKKYEKYKDVKGTSYTMTGLKSGTKYTLKIAALRKVNGKYVKGELSSPVSCTTN